MSQCGQNLQEGGINTARKVTLLNGKRARTPFLESSSSRPSEPSSLSYVYRLVVAEDRGTGGRTALIVPEHCDALLCKPRKGVVVPSDVLYEAMDEEERSHDGCARGRRPEFGVKLGVGRTGDVLSGHGCHCGRMVNSTFCAGWRGCGLTRGCETEQKTVFDESRTGKRTRRGVDGEGV
jgi:hypothetical protein